MIRSRTMLSLILLVASAAPMTAAQETKRTGVPAMESGSTGQMDPKQMAQMLANVKLMQQLMDSARQARGTKDRDSLLQEHMQLMQDNMQMMRAMGGRMAGGSEPRQREQMMEMRMDMMQMMMEQIVQHQQMTKPIPRLHR